MKRKAVWVTIAALGLLAPGALAQAGQPGQQTQKQQQAKPSAPAKQHVHPGQQGQHGQSMGQAGQPMKGLAETNAFDEADWRALALEPSEHIEKGHSTFTRDVYATSVDFRRAAAILKISATHFAGEARTSFMKSAQILEKYADDLGAGQKPKDKKDFEANLAFIEQALAQFHQQEASRLWSNREPEVAGAFLKAAIKELDSGASWSGKKLERADKKMLGDAEKVANDMQRGKAAPDAVDKALNDVTGEVQKLAAALPATGNKELAVTISSALNEKDWMSLQEEPIEEMKIAKKVFGKNDHLDAIESLRQAAALLKLQAGHVADHKAKTLLSDAANEMDQKATALQQGTLKKAGELEPLFAKADLALSIAHVSLAQKFWSDKKTFDAGSELGGATSALEQALDYKTLTAPASTKTAIKDAKKVSTEMMRGTGFKAADVDKAIGNLAIEIGKVTEAPVRQAQKLTRRQAQR